MLLHGISALFTAQETQDRLVLRGQGEEIVIQDAFFECCIANGVLESDFCGGAIYGYGCPIMLINVKTSKCRARHGGVIMLCDGSLSIQQSQFTDNTAEENVGSVWTAYSITKIIQTNVSANTANGYHGGIWVGGEEVSLSEDWIVENEAKKASGGLGMLVRTLKSIVSSCVILNNRCANVDGVGSGSDIWIQGDEEGEDRVTFEACVVDGSDGVPEGGNAIFFWGRVLVCFNDCCFDSEKTKEYGSSIKDGGFSHMSGSILIGEINDGYCIIPTTGTPQPTTDFSDTPTTDFSDTPTTDFSDTPTTDFSDTPTTETPQPTTDDNDNDDKQEDKNRNKGQFGGLGLSGWASLGGSILLILAILLFFLCCRRKERMSYCCCRRRRERSEEYSRKRTKKVKTRENITTTITHEHYLHSHDESSDYSIELQDDPPVSTSIVIHKHYDIKDPYDGDSELEYSTDFPLDSSTGYIFDAFASRKVCKWS